MVNKDRTPKQVTFDHQGIKASRVRLGLNLAQNEHMLDW
jgi:hypothetical protein